MLSHCQLAFFQLIVQLWVGTQPSLALDATTLGDRFAVLVVSVVYRGAFRWRRWFCRLAPQVAWLVYGCGLALAIPLAAMDKQHRLASAGRFGIGEGLIVNAKGLGGNIVRILHLHGVHGLPVGATSGNTRDSQRIYVLTT